MSMTFTKLFSSITESTIWVEDANTRLTWITLLAMADKRGRVWASIPGLANRARVPVEAAEAAIEKFLAPDTYSRTYTPECQGRRLEEIDGGWRLINYEKYRQIRDQEDKRERTRERVRKHREKKRNVTHVTPSNDNAEAEAEAEYITPNGVMSGKPDESAEILQFLNEKARRNFRPTKVNLKLIRERLKEGYTPTECRQVIVRKCREWVHDDKMRQYLRPATIFGREKFNQYAGELVDE